MEIITKPYTEHIVRDIDVEYLGGGTSTLTLQKDDNLVVGPDELVVVLRGRGDIYIQRRNVCWYSVRTRIVQEPLTESPTKIPTHDPSYRPAAE